MDSHTLLRSLIDAFPHLKIHFNLNNIETVEKCLYTMDFVALDTIIVDSRPRLVITDVGGESHEIIDFPQQPDSPPAEPSDSEAPQIITVDVDQQLPGLEEIERLVAKPSFKEAANAKVWNEIQSLIHKPTAKHMLINEKFKGREDVEFREFCEWGLKAECGKHRAVNSCQKLHFRRIRKPQTDVTLGDCSYLNTCHRVDQCKYIHYELDAEGVEIDIERALPVLQVGNPLPAQWISCDVRKFDLSVLGKFSVIMADPPWDIHMNLPYGTLTDDEMRTLPISELQDEGFLFLWVTGRAMELGRDCLSVWGYKRIDEIVWVKIMQLQKLIRTGRTGHWLNHSKEHCLVGVKGNPKYHNVGIDGDVLVAEVRETSRKPDEIYGLIDRLCPGTRKIEIFGRPHNTRDGWVTLGNQLEGTRICEEDMLHRYNERYPQTPVKLYVPKADMGREGRI